MATMFDFGILERITNTSVFGEPWIVIVLLALLICFMITRDMKEIGIVMLPVLLGLRISGLYVASELFSTILTIALFMFVGFSITPQGIGRLLTSATSGLSIGDRVTGDYRKRQLSAMESEQTKLDIGLAPEKRAIQKLETGLKGRELTEKRATFADTSRLARLKTKLEILKTTYGLDHRDTIVAQEELNRALGIKTTSEALKTFDKRSKLARLQTKLETAKARFGINSEPVRQLQKKLAREQSIYDLKNQHRDRPKTRQQQNRVNRMKIKKAKQEERDMARERYLENLQFHDKVNELKGHWPTKKRSKPLIEPIPTLPPNLLKELSIKSSSETLSKKRRKKKKQSFLTGD